MGMGGGGESVRTAPGGMAERATPALRPAGKLLARYEGAKVSTADKPSVRFEIRIWTLQKFISPLDSSIVRSNLLE